MEHYLDNAATTKVCDEAAQAALAAMTENYGNPSSTHTKGREANRLLEKARKQVSAALGCTPGELIFTSCGSESDNWAIINGAEAMRRRGKHIISSAVEHDAVRRSLDELESRGFEVTRLAPDEKGGVSLDSVVSALRDDTILVSLMLVNNETGAVTDISSIARAVKKACPAVLVHTDAVQGFMKVPFSAKTLGADMISISGHKIHAPKGIGALYIKNGVKLKPFIVGGSQETGRRAGTEAMPQIAAFGAACEIAQAGMAENIARMQSLRERAVQRLSREIPELVLIGGGSPHILSISLPGWRSEVLMNYLEAKEVYVSRSSACKKGGRSHVLEAMGLSSRVIDGAIRIGLSRFTTEEDIDALCSALKEAHDTLAHR
ncbi:MAG: cysteine desulfurase family protein [Candidatus Limivicinus sp.]|nr:cysteine desulfurase [Clostridiales bacterium]MCI7136663.1 cysteine desulfurase [Clostridiales bacterium]MDY6131943.1 cysteine desulfurase family protein [Candidatus Limivicinus sp.]